MTYQDDYTLSADLLARVSEDGLDALPEAIGILVNASMVAERQHYLGVRPYERSAAR